PSTAATITGKYSGRQPAITALIASFSTVVTRQPGGMSPSSSPGARPPAASIARTRASVGGTTGSPSDHCSAQKCASTASWLSASSTTLEASRGSALIRDSRPSGATSRPSGGGEPGAQALD